MTDYLNSYGLMSKGYDDEKVPDDNSKWILSLYQLQEDI